MSKELIVRLREAAAQRVASTAMIGAEDLSAAADALESLGADRDSWERQAGDRLDDVLRVVAERDALAAELKALREREPFDASDARFRDAFDAVIRYGKWPSARNGDGYRSPVTQIAWQASFHTVNRLALYARPVPARELTDAVDDLAQHIRQIDGNHSMGAGELAESIAEWADRYLKGEGE